MGRCDAQQPTNANSQRLLHPAPLPARAWAPISRRQPPPALSCRLPSGLSLPLSTGLGRLPPSLHTQRIGLGAPQPAKALTPATHPLQGFSSRDVSSRHGVSAQLPFLMATDPPRALPHPTHVAARPRGPLAPAAPLAPGLPSPHRCLLGQGVILGGFHGGMWEPGVR